jgi:hypothetical protein
MTRNSQKRREKQRRKEQHINNTDKTPYLVLVRWSRTIFTLNVFYAFVKWSSAG